MSNPHEPCPAPEQISAQIDGDLEAAEAIAVAEHLRTCGRCARLRDELQVLRGALPSLAEVEPPPALWRHIAERHAQERRAASGGWRRHLWLWPALAATSAAVVLLVVSRLQPPETPPRAATAGVTAPPASTPASASRAMAAVRQAEQQYLDAIAQLEQSVDLTRTAPRPEVRQRLEQGLAEIDSSIRRCRSALHQAPDDLAAHEIMLAAYQQKVDFLRELLDAAPRPEGVSHE